MEYPKLKVEYFIYLCFSLYRLTTESNGNIYVVSVCHPVPKSFYDPRKLAGAIKFSSNGETINLGCIDQTDVVVNGLVY